MIAKAKAIKEPDEHGFELFQNLMLFGIADNTSKVSLVGPAVQRCFHLIL
jgi:hypothetical protein